MPLNATFKRRKRRGPADSLGGQSMSVPAATDRKAGGYSRTREPVRFKGKQTVDAATSKRTKRRFKRLGITLGPGPITGYQARYAKRKLRKKRDARTQAGSI